jgi:hypothetical protein
MFRSFPRTRESRATSAGVRGPWVPAFAGTSGDEQRFNLVGTGPISAGSVHCVLQMGQSPLLRKNNSPPTRAIRPPSAGNVPSEPARQCSLPVVRSRMPDADIQADAFAPSQDLARSWQTSSKQEVIARRRRASRWSRPQSGATRRRDLLPPTPQLAAGRRRKDRSLTTRTV